MSKQVLILNAGTQCGFANGKLNQHYVELAKAELEKLNYKVLVTNVFEEYDPEAEAQKIKDSDYILVQTPGYWMTTPWQFKKYQDEVFGNPLICGGDGRSRSDASKKYGSGGFLTDKKYMISSTWNAPIEAFLEPDQFFKGRGIDAPFFSLKLSFEFIGIQQLPSFIANDVIKNPQHEEDFARFVKHIRENFAPV